MNSRRVFAIIVVVAAIVYEAVCFLVIPTSYAITCAAAFAFVQAAVLVWAALSRPAQGTQVLFLAYPRLVVPVGCAIIQAIAGILISALFPLAIAASIAIGIVLLAVSIASVITVPKAADHALAVDRRVEDRTAFMRGLQEQLEAARVDMPDGEAADAMDALIEKARYSDPASNAASAPYEEQIASALEGGNFDAFRIAEISKLLDKRNIACKAWK